MKRTYYFHRGEMIERFGPGWCVSLEMCSGEDTGIPIYKTLRDARNAINKHLDSTHTAEPQIIGTAGFDIEKGFFVE